MSEKQAKVLYNIVTKEPPGIRTKFSKDFRDFVKQCLTKDPEKRPSAADLLHHKFMTNASSHKTEFKEFIDFWTNKDNIGISLFNM